MPHSRKALSDRRGEDGRVAVIDIGSNSVRLVIFDRLRRHPQVVFNEKVLCGLGAELGKTGEMSKESVELALATLRRFRLLVRQMDVVTTLAVGTAAVRDAANGEAFIARVARETGLEVEIITGREEARLSALGVISGMPEARGVVGDLGGGSLELVSVTAGRIAERVTLPIGPVRLAGVHGTNMTAIAAEVKRSLRSVAWLDKRPREDFYLVGGAWRALSRLNMAQVGSPIPILHGFSLESRRARTLAKLVSRQHAEGLTGMSGIPQRRVPDLPVAALILHQILGRLKPARVVTSALGLREGILFDRLDPETRAIDPFIAAATELAGESGRFPEHGSKLMAWIDPVFATGAESVEQRRLRLGICLLSDISWRGHPDFRAERAVMEALYGRFVGIDHAGRGFVGLALNRLYGAAESAPLAKLCSALLGDEAAANLALRIGAALRLAQRLSGGTARLLRRSRLVTDEEGVLRLEIERSHADLVNDVIARRLAGLASLSGQRPEIRIVES